MFSKLSLIKNFLLIVLMLLNIFWRIEIQQLKQDNKIYKVKKKVFKFKNT